MLKKYRVKEYHSNKMSNKRGEFADWDEEKRRAFTACLFKILKKEKSLIGLNVAVHNESFNSAMNDFPQLKLTPYQFCCEMLTLVISKIGKAKKRMSPIAITFEAGQRNNSPFMKPPDPSIDISVYYESRGIRAINFVVGKGVIPLQIADLFAYEMYKPFANPKSNPRFTFRKLYEGFYWEGVLFNDVDSIKVQVELLSTIYSVYPDLPKVQA